MQEVRTTTVSFPSTGSRDALTEVLRSGAQRLLAEAVEAEVREWIALHAHVTDAAERRQVVRNGYLPKRSILTGIGTVQVEQPRVLDRRGAEGEVFSSKILPPSLRKTGSLEELIPWLYLKGVSTGDFAEALSALVGPGAEGLSASTVTRLKTVWEEEFKEWTERSLAGKQYVYWADGVHFNVRLEEDRQCILVLMGATPETAALTRTSCPWMQQKKAPALGLTRTTGLCTFVYIPVDAKGGGFRTWESGTARLGYFCRPATKVPRPL